MTDEVRDDLAAAIEDHDDNCSSMAIPECADRILAALPARSNPVALRAEVERLTRALYDVLSDSPVISVSGWQEVRRMKDIAQTALEARAEHYADGYAADHYADGTPSLGDER